MQRLLSCHDVGVKLSINQVPGRLKVTVGWSEFGVDCKLFAQQGEWPFRLVHLTSITCRQ